MATAKEKKNEATGFRRVASALEKLDPEFRAAAYAKLETERKARERQKTKSNLAEVTTNAASLRTKLKSAQSETEKTELGRKLSATNRKLNRGKGRTGHDFLVLPGSFGSGKRR
jgi:uncharacterized coiled-coil DUF342 family protein